VGTQARHAQRIFDIPFGREFLSERLGASNFAPAEDVARFQDLRFGLLVSFGITTRDKAELSWGTIDKAHRRMPDGDALSDGVHTPTEPWVNWAKDLKLQNFDADRWVKQAQDAGFKYIILPRSITRAFTSGIRS
jgi:alpha-L-fucosidase